MTAELGRQTLGRDLKELQPQETADLLALVDKQFELARRQNRIEQEMEQTVALLRPDEPVAADTLSDALAEARRLGIAAAMLGVGSKIRDNGLGQAADHQTILQNLQNVLDILANTRTQEGERLARELNDAARNVDGLRKRQEGLRRKLEELAAAGAKGLASDRQRAELETLLRQQEEIRQETQHMARRLERLVAHRGFTIGRTGRPEDERSWSRRQQGLRGGGKRQGEGSRTTPRGRGPPASGNAPDLAVQLAFEEQARLEDAIKHLHRQEEWIEAETREFAAIERSGPLSRAQVFGLMELAPPANAATGRNGSAGSIACRGERLPSGPFDRIF